MAMTVELPSPAARRETAYPAVDLSVFCQDLFSSFTRSDQRRWGEVYVEGLATVPGRKSIRRIAEDIAGWRADQCLQQFVNQSPWNWEPVRSRLAHHLTAELRPKAWVVEEVVFPKNGNASVGVAKQYAYSAGAMMNCQLGMAVCLAGEQIGGPVNWRLLLPSAWTQDRTRRTRAHLPEYESHKTRWGHVLDALDEMTVDWKLPPPPVVIDAHDAAPVEPLLAGLEERGLRYLVRVPSGTPVAGRTAGGPHTVTEVAAESMRRGGRTLAVALGGSPGRSQFMAVGLSGMARPNELGPGHSYIGTRRLVAEWSARRYVAKAVWLTNLNISRLPDVVDLIRLSDRTRDELERMGDDCGLRHFEGRSYQGWQHHVTLASVAYAYRLLFQMQAQDLPVYASAVG
jgi:SRSO17 transposase